MTTPSIKTLAILPEDCLTREALAEFLTTEQGVNREIVGVGLGKFPEGGINVYDYVLTTHAAEMPPIKVFPIPKATAESELTKLLQNHAPISYTPVLINGTEEDVLVAREGATLRLVGTISTFGGPLDKGMSEDEGLAIVQNEDIARDPKVAKLFRDPQRGAKGRNLANDTTHYIACRWVYSQTPRSHLVRTLVQVRNPETGVSFLARPVDWGPAKWTGRVADLSDKLAADLGLKTNQTCEVIVPLPGNVGTGLETMGRGADNFRDSLVKVALEQASKYEGIDEGSTPLRQRIEAYWRELQAAQMGDFAFSSVEVAWSAVFVSWCLWRAGALKNQFLFSAQHSQYIKNAIARAAANPNGDFVARRITERKPAPGDIIHGNRSNTEVLTYEQAAVDGDYDSHCAVVVGIGQDEHGPCAFTVGGNEKDSVRTRKVRLTADGFVQQKTPFPYISVLRTT
jgi:hypothetical protein